jgi:hypothetical protein
MAYGAPLLACFVFNPQTPVPTAALGPWSRGLVRSTPLRGATRFARVAASAPRAHCVSVPGRRGRAPLLYSLVSPPGALPGLCRPLFSVEGGPGRII